MTIEAIVLVAALVLVGIWIVRSLREPGATATSSAVRRAIPARPAGKPQSDPVAKLKALLFADQSLQDEVLSFVPFAPEVKPILDAVDSGQCEEAMTQVNRLAAASPSKFHIQLLLAHVRARCGDRSGAAETLKEMLPAVEQSSLATLQTWHRLRDLGAEPPAQRAREVLGLIVEVELPEGTETIAAYADGTARVYTWQGGGVLGAEHRPEVGEAARRLVAAAGACTASAEKERVREAVPPETVRFTFLSMAGPLVATATPRALDDEANPLRGLLQAAAQLRDLKLRGFMTKGSKP